MGVLSIGVLIVGLAAAGILNVLANAERPTVVRAARILLGFGISASPLAPAALFAGGNSNPNHVLRPTRSGWWAYVAIGALPMLVGCSLGVRRAFAERQRRLALLVADAVAAAEYLAVPFAFRPLGHELRGLSLWAYDHHV